MKQEAVVTVWLWPSCGFIEKNLSYRKWSGRGGNKGPKGPTRVVGDPVPLRLHDDLSLPHGAQQVRAEVRSEKNE